MDYPKFIVSNQKEEFISIQRVNILPDVKVESYCFWCCLHHFRGYDDKLCAWYHIYPLVDFDKLCSGIYAILWGPFMG